MSSTNSRIPRGFVTVIGSSTRWRFTVAHIMSCRASYAGSPPILVFITSIICVAGYLTTDCHSCCVITRNWASSGDLRWARVSGVCGWCSGTKISSDLSLSMRCVSVMPGFEGEARCRPGIRCLASAKGNYLAGQEMPPEAGASSTCSVCGTEMVIIRITPILFSGEFEDLTLACKKCGSAKELRIKRI
jgi:hypothetical protein